MTVNNKSFIFLDEVDSTNNYVLLNSETLSSFSMVTAKRQTAGKGRRGNKWISDGENFYGTMLIKNSLVAPVVLGWIASLATLEVLRQYAPSSEFRIKWPNDIYCRGKKISGALCEVRNDSSNKPLAVAIGIGVNLNMKEEEAAAIGAPATSLYIETANVLSPEEFALFLAESISRFYNEAVDSGDAGIFSVWKKENCLIGREIEVSDAKKNILRGTVIDIKNSGELLLRSDSGEEKTLGSGDITIKSASGFFCGK